MARRRNPIVGCHCMRCMGYRSKWAKTKIQDCISSVRQQTKQLLKKQEYDKALDVIISTGYLD